MRRSTQSAIPRIGMSSGRTGMVSYQNSFASCPRDIGWFFRVVRVLYIRMECG